jgi:hypothetical protein
LRKSQNPNPNEALLFFGPWAFGIWSLGFGI